MAVPIVAHEVLLVGVHMRVRDAPDGAVLLEQVHRTEIGEERDGEPGEADEGRIVVDGRAEHGAGLGEEARALLRGLGKPARSLRLRDEGEMLFVRALLLRHHRREGEGERGSESHECLEEQEGLVGVVAMEGALAVEGAPESHGGKHEGCGDRLALAEPEGRPGERGHRDEIDRIVSRAGQEGEAEHELADHDEREEEEASLDEPRGSPARPGRLRPQDEQGSDEGVARCIAQPPRQPDRGGVSPRSEAPEDERAHADRGADHGAHQPGEDEELDHVLATIEGAQTRGKAHDKVGAHHRFEGIAGRYTQRGRHGAGGGDVRHEGAHEHRGPHAIASEEQHGQRDSRRRPYRGGAGMDEGEGQPELGGEDVERGDEDESD